MINSSEIDMGTKRVAFRFPGELVDFVFVDLNNRISRPEYFTYYITDLPDTYDAKIHSC